MKDFMTDVKGQKLLQHGTWRRKPIYSLLLDISSMAIVPFAGHNQASPLDPHYLLHG